MADGHDYWEKTVNKLKGRLQEAMARGCDEDAVKKVLQRLVAVPMTLELLQVTHIGKEVNGLRKMEGDVGKTAKKLVRSWKQLLARGREERVGEGMGREERVGEGVGREEKVGGERDSEKRRSKDRHALSEDTPLPHCSTGPASTPAPTTTTQTASQCLVGNVGEVVGSTVGGEESGSAGHRKRKAVMDRSVDAVAHTKRSRTLVYSGKKTSSGPQAVTSLFDMSMKILIDNIDAIEEVGGVPYLILEPLLQKCTVSQLLRLEEFNPHFLEDSDVLWKKHCEKDFRGSRPLSQQSWRELYLSKLSDREEKLRNITANIRKREEARKEPVRQVKLATATRAPGRRHHVSSIPLPSRPSLMNSRSSSFRSGHTSNSSKLKKQTMKMMKERSLMAMSRPGKR